MSAEKENGAASVGAETTPRSEPKSQGSDAHTLTHIPENVKWRKRSDELRYLHLTLHIPSKDMIEAVKTLHPKFDKYAMSKAENSDSYGLEISRDSLGLLWKQFAPEEYRAMKKKKDGHKFSNRVQCRLDDDTFKFFVAKSRADGFKTLQDCLLDLIRAYTARSDSDA